jgi:uncharacterized protein
MEPDTLNQGDDAFAELPMDLNLKLDRCCAIVRDQGRLAVAFSGGTDSTLLLALSARTLGADNVLAAVGVSPSLPERELGEARALAEGLGVALVEIHTREMDDPDYATNPTDRCFHCKTELFTQVARAAGQRGFAVMASGANVDDLGDYRPGLLAGENLGVINPLMEASLDKQDIRAASRALGLPTWDKPAQACLASRIPYGQGITPEKLLRIERGEEALKAMGFATCRLRDHGDVARIEVPADQIARAVELRGSIVEAIGELGYAYVTLDLKGFRSGSLNETLSGD